MTNKEQAAQIAALNDKARKGLDGCTRMLTVGVRALDPYTRSLVLAKVRNFSEFTPGNDPHGEHDFGRVTYEGTSVFFKMDYYAKGSNYTYGSEDATNPEVTDRVLTIMLCEEY